MNDDLDVYAIGLCACSVCTTLTDLDLIEKIVNERNPTGIASAWKVSAGRFETGAHNPHQCENCPERQHYLLTC